MGLGAEPEFAAYLGQASGFGHSGGRGVECHGSTSLGVYRSDEVIRLITCKTGPVGLSILVLVVSSAPWKRNKCRSDASTDSE